MQNFSFKRLTAWLLTFVMLVSLVPANVSASVIDEFLGDVSAYFRSQGDSASASGAMINAATTGMDVETFDSRNSDPVVVIAGSDYQASGASGTMQTIMKQIKNDYDSVYGALLGGDYDHGDGTTTAADIEAVAADIDAVFPEIPAEHRIYLQGNHESWSELDPNDSNLMKKTGAYDTDHYGVYAINHKDYPWSYSNPTASLVQSTAAGLDEYLDAKADEQYDKPIFVMSHLPLHYSTRTSSSGDGQYAKYLYDVLDEAGDKGLNIIFLFGHNHSSTYDDYLGGGQIYLEVGDSICVAEQDSKNSYFTDTLSFTYLNYGYVGAIKGKAGTNLSMTSFEIADDQVIVNRYGTSGTVKLKAKGVTTSGAPTADTSTVASGAVIELNQFEPAAALTGISVTAPTKTAYVVGDALDTTGMVVTASYDDGTTKEVTGYEVSADLTSAGTKTVTVTYKEKTATFEVVVYAPVADENTGVTVAAPGITGLTVEKITEDTPADSDYSAYVSYDINPVGYTSGSAVVTVPVPESFDAGKPVQVLDGDTVLTTTTIKNGTVTFTATHFSVYSVAQAADSALEWKEIPGGIVYKLDTDGLTAGTKYLIVNTGTDGSGVALRNAGEEEGTTNVTISGGTIILEADTDVAWTPSNSTSGHFENQGKYLRVSTNGYDLVTGSSSTIEISNEGNGAYQLYVEGSGGLWWGSVTYYLAYTSGSWDAVTAESNVYLYECKGTGNGGYAAMTGETVYNIITNTTDEETLKTKIRNNLIVYTASDANGTDAAVTTDYTLSGTCDPTEAGTYTYTVAYGGVELGTVTVNVVDKSISSIDVNPASGSVTVGASEAALVGANIMVNYADGDTATIPVTVGMLSGSFDTSVAGTYSGLTVTYNGFTVENFTLTVKEKVVNNYPSYPNEGAVKVDKTAHGVDFQKTGVARVELSTSGVPMNQGVDVLLVLDTSSSMGMKGSLTDSGRTRMDVLKECVNALIVNLKKDRLDGSAPNIDIAIVDFNGYTGNKNTNYIGSTARSTSTLGGQLTDGWVDIRTLSDTWANNNIPDDRSGTNYDHGLLQAYDLLKQKQNDNGDNTRKQFVLFMSDGAPFQYNGVNSNSLSSDWENWILGSYTRAQVENLSHVANPEFYYGNNNGNGQKHRVAEAIKGAPDSKFQIVTYSDTSSSGTTKLEEVNGLGATMYSVGLALEGSNMPTDAAGQETILKTIASSDDVFYSVTSAAGLQEAFDDFAGAILYAAENAVFEDQLGEHYNIQLANTTKRLVDGKEFTLDPAPTMEVREYTIWTRAELEDVNGNLSEENAKRVGTRKTDVNGNYIYNTLEIVTFNEAGTEAYTDGDTTNIMDNNGVICAKTFWYNNGTATVKVDVDGDGTTETDLAPETFIWKVGTIKTKEIALSYYVYLDDSLEGDASAGSYVTNEYAILSYDNYLGNPCSKDTTSPQMAWLAANVSYAYYLVNSEGKPVNANGEEVTFANREVIVHPTIFGEIKLNSIEDVENLTVASTGVLDEGNYALYDYDAKYQLNVNSDATGGWEITVGNGKALSTYVTGFSDTLAFTNATESTSDVDNYDYTHTTVWFAVVWEPRTVEDTVVIDYGLPVEVHVLTNDFFGDFGELIGVAAGTVTNSDNDITTNEIPATGSSLVEGRFGTAQVIKSEAGANESNSAIRYTLNTSNGMQMGATDVFTYSVEYTNTKLHTNNGFYYGTLTIIPATSIYYEETFLTFTNYDGSIWSDESAQTGSGFWSQIQDGYEDDVTQSEDRPGNINFAFDTVVDANNIYGYDPAYSNYTKYSLGQAMKVTVDKTTGNGNNAPVASFTFTGRGFDIISLTDKDSGLIIVEYTNKETNVTKKTLVDNYYGYEYLDASVVVYDNDSLAVTENEVSFTVSGKSYKYTNENRNIDYYGYNCPLVSSVSGSDKVYYILASELINSDDEINFWQPVDNTNETTNTIWQVPVIKIDNLEYAEYTVVIKVAYMSALDHLADGSYSFWMDAVRIYDPANGGAADGTDDTTIEDAYKDDKETYPDYKEIGDLLIAQNDLSTDPATRGVVFIDGRDEVEVAVSDYSNPGPNNEVYLAEGQGIAFSLTASKKPLSTQIGAKLAYGSNGVLMYNGEQLLNNGLSTATDMYYEIEVNWTGDDTNGWTSDVIVLSSGNESTLGTNVISLTNIKNTFDVSGSTVSVGTAAQAAEVGVFMMRRLYTPAPEVFVPETFEVECSSNKNGKNVTVTVKASTDVEYITINGIEMYNYKEKKGVRTWSYKPKNNELADQYEIAAFNTDGLASGIVCVSAEGKSTAYTADSLKQSSETNFATALRDTGVVSEKNAEKMQNLIEKLSNRIFTPEKFVQKLSKISDGSEFMMVNTSEDVEYIIADGEIINNYITETVIDLSNDGEETVNRVWIIPEANADSDIAAYNAEGVTSEAQSNG